MRRAVLAALLALVGGGLIPAPVLACSCQYFDSLRDWVEEYPDWGMVVGQVVTDRGDGSWDFAVARWYGGDDRRPVVVLRTQAAPINGMSVMDSCATGVSMGQRLLFLGTIGEEGAYRIGYCSLMEDPASEHGQALERHAAELIGPAEEPRPPVTTPETARSEPAATAPVEPTTVVGGVVAAAALLFAIVIVVGLRARPRT